MKTYMYFKKIYISIINYYNDNNSYILNTVISIISFNIYIK